MLDAQREVKNCGYEVHTAHGRGICATAALRVTGESKASIEGKKVNGNERGPAVKGGHEKLEFEDLRGQSQT